MTHATPQQLAASTHPTNLPDVLATYPHVTKQPVAWGDMDAYNHVNNVVFYRYAETARINYLTALGISLKDITMVLAHSSCAYLKPVVYPDTLLIGARTKRLGDSSFTMEYAFYSTKSDCVVASGDAVLVRLDKNDFKKTPLTQQERDAILAFEQTVGRYHPTVPSTPTT